MTVFARSDVSAVSISPAHGGCGETHSRPAPGGNPVMLWALDCPSCEDHLRSHPLWAALQSEIPETPDEIRLREDGERRGALDQQKATAEALRHLASLGDLPAILSQLTALVGASVGGQLAAAPQTLPEAIEPPKAVEPPAGPSESMTKVGEAMVEGLKKGLSDSTPAAPPRRRSS